MKIGKSPPRVSICIHVHVKMASRSRTRYRDRGESGDPPKPVQKVKPYPSDTNTENWAQTISHYESDDDLCCIAADSGSEEESDGPRIRQTNYPRNKYLNAPESNRPRKASKKTNYFPEVVFHKLQEFGSKIESSPICRKLQSEIESRPILKSLWSRIKSRPILVSLLIVLFVFLIIPGPISPVAVE